MKETVNERIKTLFDESKMNQTQFALKADISQPYLSQILAGKRAPENRVIKTICNNFGVTEEWLTGESEIKSLPVDELTAYVEETANEFDKPVRNIVIAILKAYKDLSPDEQEKVIKFAKSFIDNLR